jgi:DNA-directed RNA polymerase specialized sigma24 family protein
VLARPTGAATVVLPPSFTPDRFLPASDPSWPGHWALPPEDWTFLLTDPASPVALQRVRAAVGELPFPLRDVLVDHDIAGLNVVDIGRKLGRDAAEVRRLLDDARGFIRSRFELTLEAEPE